MSSASAESRERTLDTLRRITDSVVLRPPHGRVTSLSDTMIRTPMTRLKVGEICRLGHPGQEPHRLAEVVGFESDETLLLPLGSIDGLSPDCPVIPTGGPFKISVGEALMGRVLDAATVPLDGSGPLTGSKRVSIRTPPYPAIDRGVISEPFSTGIRAIDGPLTLGIGQRVGITGAPGSGKSSLMAAILRNAQFDVAVVAMIGERGREAREFLERGLPEEDRARCVMVVSTSEESAGSRVLGADSAVRIAEDFADRGHSVLLMFDSLTRYARAKRDIGLSIGEAPTRRGFTPRSLSSMAGLIEKCGLRAKGSITAFFTILTEGDPEDDPVREEALSLLDGHIELSATLAERGHYPAIDILHSKSRLLESVMEPRHVQSTLSLRDLMQAYQEVELLVQIGEYQEGTDPRADRALEKRDAIEEFLRQDMAERPRRLKGVSASLRRLVQ